MTTNSTNSTERPERDWIVRTLPSGQVIDLSGYAVEILGANPLDATGVLYTSMNRDGFDSPFSADGVIVTLPGVRRVGQFQYVKYVGVQSVPTAGFVKVRVYTKPRAAYVECDPGGKMRTRVFARNINGGLVVGAGLAQNIVDTTLLPQPGPITPDPFWQDEQHWERMYWWGYVAAAGTFKVYSAHQHNPNDVTEPFKIHGAFDPRTPVASAAVLTAIGGSAANLQILDFTTGTGATSTSNTASCRQPIPPGNVRMCVENTTAGNLTFFYVVGCCAFQ